MHFALASMTENVMFRKALRNDLGADPEVYPAENADFVQGYVREVWCLHVALEIGVVFTGQSSVSPARSILSAFPNKTPRSETLEWTACLNREEGAILVGH